MYVTGKVVNESKQWKLSDNTFIYLEFVFIKVLRTHPLPIKWIHKQILKQQ